LNLKKPSDYTPLWICSEVFLYLEKKAMTGIRYITDEKGQKTDLIISLEEHGQIVEDILDALLVEERKTEDSVSLDLFVQQLIAEGKFDA